jgi:thioredoxin 1
MAHFDLTEENLREAINGNEVLLVDFWAGWCAPCKIFAPIFERASEKYPDIAFASCDVEAQQSIAAMFGVSSIPTLTVFKEQIMIFQQAGALPEAVLEDLLQKTIKLDMDEVRKELGKQRAGEKSDTSTSD